MDYDKNCKELFELTKKNGLNALHVFHAKFKGIPFEIKYFIKDDWAQHSDCGEENSWWTYYLYLKPDNFTKKDWETIIENRSKGFSIHCDALDDLDFHGGISFFKYNEKHNYMKVGCDYKHLCDFNRSYSVEKILHDVKKNITGFLTDYVRSDESEDAS